MFASQNQAKVTNPCISLENMKKIQLCTQAFLTKMQGVIEKLVVLGCSMTDKEVISFILEGLGCGYHPLVPAIGVVTTPMMLSML
jgi:hypothetical protein